MTTAASLNHQAYLDDFAALDDGAGSGFAATRRQALDRFIELGFPTMRHEDWRFTNVGSIASTRFRLADAGAGATAADVARCAVAIEGAPLLVFVNGWFAPKLSALETLPAGVELGTLGVLLEREPGRLEALAGYADWRNDAFVALNTAFTRDGAYLRVPKGVAVPQPVQVLYLTTAAPEPTVAYPRNLLLVEEGAEATVIEHYAGLGDGTYLTDAVTELVAGDNANVDHYRVVREAAGASHVGLIRLQQGRDTTVCSQVVTLGGGLVRNNVTSVLDGTGGHCAMRGLYVPRGKEHVDNFLRVEHRQPHCDSREFFRGVLDDAARAVFTGRIVVAADAQKTDAKQTNMNLMLSESARVDTKPQLEIFADDVKCTHGATIGQVDDEAVFYLRARGIEQEAARSMLIFAFAGESLDHVRVEPLRARLRDALFERLPGGEQLRGAV